MKTIFQITQSNISEGQAENSTENSLTSIIYELLYDEDEYVTKQRIWFGRRTFGA